MTTVHAPWRVTFDNGAKVRDMSGHPTVDYTLNGVYELLKRLDMAWISARSVSPNANPARQAEFKKKLGPGGTGRSAA